MNVCDHMDEDDGFVFCDINRQFPSECQQCAAYLSDMEPYPHRVHLWRMYSCHADEAQSACHSRSPGEGDA